MRQVQLARSLGLLLRDVSAASANVRRFCTLPTFLIYEHLTTGGLPKPLAGNGLRLSTKIHIFAGGNHGDETVVFAAVGQARIAWAGVFTI